MDVDLGVDVQSAKAMPFWQFRFNSNVWSWVALLLVFLFDGDLCLFSYAAVPRVVKHYYFLFTETFQIHTVNDRCSLLFLSAVGAHDRTEHHHIKVHGPFSLTSSP